MPLASVESKSAEVFLVLNRVCWCEVQKSLQADSVHCNGKNRMTHWITGTPAFQGMARVTLRYTLLQLINYISH